MKRAGAATPFNLKVEFSREVDGRWIADIPALPGVTVYGRTPTRARIVAEKLAICAIADRIEHGEAVPEVLAVFKSRRTT
jgi:predicted RNase H-like HicB family nuclease